MDVFERVSHVHHVRVGMEHVVAVLDRLQDHIRAVVHLADEAALSVRAVLVRLSVFAVHVAREAESASHLTAALAVGRDEQNVADAVRLQGRLVEVLGHVEEGGVGVGEEDDFVGRRETAHGVHERLGVGGLRLLEERLAEDEGEGEGEEDLRQGDDVSPQCVGNQLDEQHHF